MKLFKILNVVGNRGVSVFPPEDQDMPPAEDMMEEPIGRLVRQIVTKGYTAQEAHLAIQAWAYHAKYDLNQAPRGVRTFCEMCVREIPVKGFPAPPVFWGAVVAVAVLAAVALGLYVWVALDQEYNVRFGTHPWAYLLSYNERLWQGEILNVGYRQEGLYEQGPSFGSVLQRQQRGASRVRGVDWFWFRPGALVLEGRKVIFYHVYQITGFKVSFCGVMSKFGYRLYKLRSGGYDRYKPRGPWTRPGGRFGTPEYQGSWVRWWWL